MQRQLRLAAGAGIGHDAKQRPRFEVEARAGPERAKYGLLYEFEELLHDGVAVDAARRLLDLDIAHQLPPHRIALAIELALGHFGLLLCIRFAAILPWRSEERRVGKEC